VVLKPMRLFHFSITYVGILFLGVALDPLLYLPITGRYDAATAAAVRRFQRGYQLEAPSGVVDPATWSRLEKLRAPDDSTAHFGWTEMLRDVPGPAVPTHVRENARRTMYKLEAVRRKLGDRTVIIKCGFHQPADEDQESQIGGNRLHALAAAVDITAFTAGRTEVYRAALTSGFTGIGPEDRHWQHCDSRLEFPELRLTTPWYAGGTG
jgi:hypothetical protein